MAWAAPDFYDGEVFGSEATTRARNTCRKPQELAQQLWAEAFRYAQQSGDPDRRRI